MKVERGDLAIGWFAPAMPAGGAIENPTDRLRGYGTRSSTAAMPWPTPTHIVTSA